MRMAQLAVIGLYEQESAAATKWKLVNIAGIWLYSSALKVKNFRICELRICRAG